MNDMAETNNAMARLVEQLSKLPGIGKRSAERLAFHLLKADPEDANSLAAAITDLKRNVHHCRDCFNLCDGDLCDICTDAKRDRDKVLVVEQPKDVATMESTGMFDGLYHVLMGRLSPLDGVGPGELNVAALIDRVKRENIKEVILGTNPTLEGDGTALYLTEALGKTRASVTRLARGLPTGVSLEQASKAVLADALEGRKSVQ